MRAWLGLMIAAVVATGGFSLYLVQTAPPPAADDAPPASGPEPEPPRREPATLDAYPLAPTGLEPGLAARQERNLTAPGENLTLPPADGAASGNASASPAGGSGTGSGSGSGTGGGTSGSGGAPTGGGGGGAASPPAPDPEPDAPEAPDDGPDAPPAPTPRWWNWTHDYTRSGSPDAFLVPAGFRELEYKVVFAGAAGGIAASTPVSANLVGPDGVVKVPCTAPALLLGQHVCGPFRTPALGGRWEVQYAGASPVTASLSLRELP